MTVTTLKARVLAVASSHPGMTDRELTDRLLGRDALPQAVNQLARQLAAEGRLARRVRADGLIGNYPVGTGMSREALPRRLRRATDDLPDTPRLPLPRSSDVAARHARVDPVWPAEDFLKRCLKDYLERDGWRVTVMWGKDRGIDIEAFKDNQRWLIEVKGGGSSPPMNVNYFIGMLGETLQRMSDPNALYSIALPDQPQFRGLWQRLPTLAKERTSIGAFFVAQEGTVEHQC